MLRNQLSNMIIEAIDLGKKYGKNWIFRHLNFRIEPGSKIAITGKNGSGKSTLLQIISGYLTPSQGKVSYDDQDDPESCNIAYVGPYLELVEEFTLLEFLVFHSKFRVPNVQFEEMAQKASLPLDQLIGDFSTGMKQRVKLMTAFFFENDLIFFDEPTSNLDDEGFQWWNEELEKLSSTVLIASNQISEIKTCEKSISL